VSEEGEYRLAEHSDPEEERLSWMQYEFSKEDLFDPAQLNLVILNSGICYQYLKELRAGKTAVPSSLFGYAAD